MSEPGASQPSGAPASPSPASPSPASPPGLARALAPDRTGPSDPVTGGGGGGRRRLKVLAPVTAAVAVVVVAAGAVVLQRHAGTDSAASPPKLHLVDVLAAEQADLALSARGGAGAPGYRIQGTLPDGPTRGRVRTLGHGPAPQAAVAQLATALGVSGTPIRRGDGWTVEGGGTVLRVADDSGWHWEFGRGISGGPPGVHCDVIVYGRRACPPEIVSPAPGKVIPVEPPNAGGPIAGAEPGSGSTGSGSTGSGSTGSGSTGSGSSDAGTSASAQPPNIGTSVPGGPDAPIAVPVPVPVDPALPRPSAGDVRKAAGPVLVALGLDGGTIRVETYPGLGLVTAAPVLDGLPTSGLETRLSHAKGLHLTGGSGWLGKAEAGTEYPLVSAKRALDRLPVPMIAAIPCTDVEPSRCRPIQPVITGARPGLMLSWEESGTALLVPAWLYDVQGMPMLLAAVAVDPAFLATPTPPKGQPATGTAVPPEPAPGSGSGGPPVPVPKPTR